VPGLPLAGVKVLCLAHQYPGPFATAQLSDLGADVVVVERPDGGDPTRAMPGFHASLARGKRSLALDLKAPEGKRVLELLIADADVLLEGFRPGTMTRLGFAPERIRDLNDALVYVSISGFGQTGPYRDRAGHDLTYQAEAGMLYESLERATPASPPSIAWADLSAGLFATQAVLTGLFDRERNGGEGVHVDVSMFDCVVTLLSAHVGPVVNDTGPAGFPYEPGYGVFVTSDGRHLAFGVAHEDPFWRELCDLLGLQEHRGLTSTQRFEQSATLQESLRAAVGATDSAVLAEALEARDVPYGWVRTLEELPDLPHVRARALVVSTEAGGRYVRQPLVLDGVAPGPRAGPPALGGHTVAVLEEAGLDERAITDLLTAGVVRQAVANPSQPTKEPAR
jgi:crotonobetainyl-CoA:carnitine CoA-transferase CaiB-like acyl-CoA transferase